MQQTIAPILTFPHRGERKKSAETKSTPGQNPTHTPGNGIMLLNFAMVFSLSSRLERLTLGNFSFHAKGRTA